MEKALATFGIVILLIVVGVYVLIGVFLNKFNKLVEGKGTALAFIPICNIYLLGKLTFNKIVSWVLVILNFLTSTFSVTENGQTKTYSLLPESIAGTVSTIFSLGVLGLFIYAIVKYNKLKREKNNAPMPQQPMPQPAPTGIDNPNNVQ